MSPEFSAPGAHQRRIDLNADLGEEVTDDAALLAVITSANVACGFHAGTPGIMREVCERAVELGVVIGAQVSYRDRDGFGRRPMDPAADVLAAWVAEQVAALAEIAAAAGGSVAYVKPHGALYNRVADDLAQARAVLAGSGELPVLGLPGSAFAGAAVEDGRRAVLEGFPDRGYTGAGRLIPRGEPGALIEGAADIAAQALALASSGTVHTVCVHGDSPGAVAAAKAVRAALEANGFAVSRW